MRLYYATHPKQYVVRHSARCRKVHKKRDYEWTECNLLMDRLGYDTNDQLDRNVIRNGGMDRLCGNCYTKNEKIAIIEELRNLCDEQ